MPSSLIVAALAAAWLVVLVPMIAKRRQEVTHVAESVLASRVLPRPRNRRTAVPYEVEVRMTGDPIAAPDLESGERQYRPGRGGYDPEAAALAAQARYRLRQRVVLGLLGAAVLTLALGFAYGVFWSLHAVLDVALIGYLVYLRRQVRIEEELRNRRAARMAGSRSRMMPPAAEYDVEHEEAEPYPEPRQEQPVRADQRTVQRSVTAEERPERAPADEQPVDRRPGTPTRPAHPTAVAVDLDDDDPLFDELDPAFEPRYRRAAGE